MRRRKNPAASGLTLIELLVVVALIGLVAAILLPVFASVREKGRRTACLSNMKQIALAMTAYAQDNEGFFPPLSTSHTDWAGSVYSYVQAKDVFRCPSIQVPPSIEALPLGFDSRNRSEGYAMNLNLSDAETFSAGVLPRIAGARVQFPTTTVALTESAYFSVPVTLGIDGISTNHEIGLAAPEVESDLPAGEAFIGPPGGLRHNGGSNYAFVDGHIHWYAPAQVLNSEQANNGSQPSFAL